MVTVCGEFQFVELKMIVGGSGMVISPSLATTPEKVMVTSDWGMEVNTSVKESEPPSSVVVNVVSETVTPAASASALVTVTLSGSTP